MKMNAQLALAILAWFEVAEGRALPQPQFVTATALAIPGVATANVGVAVAKPATGGLLPPLPAVPAPVSGQPLGGANLLPPLPPVPVPVSGQPLGGAGLLLPSFPPPAFPAVPLAIPNLASGLPKLPLVDTLPLTLPTGLPKVPTPDVLTLPKLPLDKVSLPLPLPTGLKVPAISDVPLPKLPLPDVGIPKLPPLDLPTPKLPNLDLPTPKLPLPDVAIPKLPPLDLPTPKLPDLGLPPLKLPLPKTPLPNIPLTDLSVGDAEAVANFVKIGKTVFGSLLSILANAFNGVKVPSFPPVAVPAVAPVPAVNGTVPSSARLGRRQAIGATNVVAAASTPAAGVGGLLGGLTGGSGPLGGVVGTVANTVGSVPVVGGAAAPVLNTVGGVTSGSNPLGAVGGAVGGVTSTVGGVASSVPVVGGAVQGVTNTVGSTLNSALSGPYPLGGGFPGSDPVGGLSISIIATLLSLLKKDPLSLFGGLGGTGGLIKRDVPELADTFEMEKSQLAGLPSLSTGIPGIGIGALPLSGIPGVSPDLAFLVGSIAKNIAVPGGKGLGSVTGNILSVLNGVVPNFLFKLPVVQDSVPTFGALQLLSSINPAKFGSLADLTNLANLSQAAAGISAGDLAFIRTLPASPDAGNLITTITTLTDNILSLPGNVANVRAAVSVLCLKNLGLSVPGL